MGAESSILENCQWGPQVACPPKFPWEMSPVTKPDGTSATVFEPKNSDNKDEDFLRKFAATLRGLRHPNIIRFVGCGNSPDGFWLATEPVVPLFGFVSDMSSQELCAGLYDLLQGLDFMHSKLGICHNNICLLSVYVSPDGSWKWGGLEHACRFAEATQEYLDRCRPYRHEDSLSPEEKTSRVKVGGAHARDVFAFGALIDAVLGLVKDKDNCAQMLEQQLSVCLSPDPSVRPSVGSLLNLSVFRSDLIQTLSFLHHITAKTEPEKKAFFSALMARLHDLPEMAIARRLVVPLLARFVLLDESAVAHVLPHLLIPKGFGCRKPSAFVQGLLPEHLFRQFVINHIYNIFHVYDCHVRLVLLDHFSQYVNMFTRQQLEDDIFIQILLGVRDSDDRLVAASLRALADLVPILGGDAVVGGIRKPFFFHGMPKVSANDFTKVPVPNNMMAVLKDHKPLLKNLALSAQSAIDKNLTERETRMREREQRREEARLKREEKRSHQKERQTDSRLEENSDREVISEDQSSKVTSEDQSSKVISEDQSSKVTSEDQSSKVTSEDHSSKVIEHVGDSDEVETLKSSHGNSRTDDRKRALMDGQGHDQESDWSDWEDADKQMNDEIELELLSMSSSVSLEHKVQTSPSPYTSNSPPPPTLVKVDWSNTNSPVRVSTSAAGSLPFGDNTRQAGGDKQLDLEGSCGEDLRTKEHHNHSSLPGSVTKQKLNGTSTKHSGKKTPGNTLTDDLGAGLDIKSINIVRRSTPPELDFFAGMAPVIAEPSSTLLTTLLVSESTDRALDGTPSSHLDLARALDGTPASHLDLARALDGTPASHLDLARALDGNPASHPDLARALDGTPASHPDLARALDGTPASHPDLARALDGTPASHLDLARALDGIPSSHPELARAVNSELFAVSSVVEEEVRGWGEDDGIDWDIETQHGIQQADESLIQQTG